MNINSNDEGKNLQLTIILFINLTSSKVLFKNVLTNYISFSLDKFINQFINLAGGEGAVAADKVDIKKMNKLRLKVMRL